MATNFEFIQYIMDQIQSCGEVTYKKMFGEYMIYVNKKPIIIVCDNTSYVKILDAIKVLMINADKGYPYDGAKEHYVLDVDDREFVCKVITQLEQIIPLPKPKKHKV